MKSISVPRSSTRLLSPCAAAVLLAIAAVPAAFAQSAPGQASGYELTVDPLADGIALGGLALAAIGSEFLDEAVGDFGYRAPPLGDLSAWDQDSIRPYSASLDRAGDLGAAACLLLPALPAFVGQREVSLSRPLGKAESLPDWIEIGAMYGESLAAAYALKNILKSFIPRARPYYYGPDTPQDLLQDGDSIRSFPSGHAALAFTAASFASTVFILRNPDSPWSIPWMAACLGAASAVSIMRTECGAHFWGDIVAGAGIGIAAGTLTPLLHLRRKADAAGQNENGALSYALGPAGLSLAYRH